MSQLFFDLYAADGLCRSLSARLNGQVGQFTRRDFPDGETYLRFETPVAGEDVILLCTLDRPNSKLASLLLAADTARQQEAKSVGLVAPYLAYMRQDKQFQPGEAITSKTFAQLLSASVDWLVTVDPHLHRYASLDAIYSIPVVAVSAAEGLAAWIKANVEQPVLIGPDEESLQWVSRIAELAQASAMVLRKMRSGDYSVSIDPSGLESLGCGTPVLVDDIASSARTLIEAAGQIRATIGKPPVCAVVHAIFASDSYSRLLQAGVQRVVSTNSVSHPTNAVDISPALATGIRKIAN